MTNNAPDYEDNLAFEPKSADDLNKQSRESDVLLWALEKCEKLELEVKQLRALLKECLCDLTKLSGKYGYCVAEDTNKIITKIETVISER